MHLFVESITRLCREVPLLASPHWLVVPILLPLAAGLLSFVVRRGAFAVCLAVTVANLLASGVLAGRLLTAGIQDYPVGNWSAPLGIALRLDGPAFLFLAMTAVTAFAITLFARGYFSVRIAAPRQAGRHATQQRYFWPLWMLLLAGLNGLYLAGDIFNIYVTLEVVGIAAVALAALSGKPAAQIAAFRYLLVSLLGSLSYLLGVTFLYKTYAVLDLGLLANLAGGSPGARAGLVLITVGLLLKAALFPLHFWLPPAHANALAPVSAILSALVVKGPVYLLFRFWFEIFAPVSSPAALFVIGLLGSGAILWGAMQALRQQRLKLLIAYSTVSQLGYLFIAFPLVRPGTETGLWAPLLFMALGHAWAKAAMFMVAGAVFLHAGHDRIDELSGIRRTLPVSGLAYALAGVNLMGLPPTGGFVGKWLLLSSSLRNGQWWWGLVIMTGSLLAAAYVYLVVSRLFVVRPGEQAVARLPHAALLEWPALGLALLAFLLGLAAPATLGIIKAGPMLAAAGGG